MFATIFVIIAVVVLGIAVVIARLGQSESLSVKAVEHLNDDLYLIRLAKPQHLNWEAGAYAKVTLPTVTVSKQKQRWLTIASTVEEAEVLLLTHQSGSLYKQHLTTLSVGSQVTMSWVDCHLAVNHHEGPLVCFASDVGIAAMRPLVTTQGAKRVIHLNHLAKGVLVFDQELRQLSRQQPNVSYVLSDDLMQSHTDMTQAVATYGNQALYLLAGPQADVLAFKQLLVDNGIELQRIKQEIFRGVSA